MRCSRKREWLPVKWTLVIILVFFPSPLPPPSPIIVSVSILMHICIGNAALPELRRFESFLDRTFEIVLTTPFGCAGLCIICIWC